VIRLDDCNREYVRCVARRSANADGFEDRAAATPSLPNPYRVTPKAGSTTRTPLSQAILVIVVATCG
jgi:hypothetical protein